MLGLLLDNVSVVFVTLIPIWAFYFGKLKLKGDSWFSLIETSILMVAATVFYFPLTEYKITSQLHWYAIFLAIYMLVFAVKFGRNDNGKLLSLALMVTFIVADYWEFPVFVYGALGWFGGRYVRYFHPFYQIHHVYILAVFILFVKQSKFQFNMKSVSLLVLAFVVPFLVLPVNSILTRLFTMAIFVPILHFGLVTNIQNHV